MTKRRQDDFIFFQKSFWGGIGRGDFTFWGGDYSKGLCFWVAWEGEVLLFFKVGRLGFCFVFQKILLWWCGMGWNFFFIIWWLNEDIFSRKYFRQINVIFLGMNKLIIQKLNFENLTKRSNNILFKTKLLIHLTQKGKNRFLNFFLWLIFLCTW